MKSSLKVVLVLGSALVSAFSSADPFIAVSAGSFNLAGDGASYTSSESILSGVFAPLVAPTSLEVFAPFTSSSNYLLGVTGGVATFKNGTSELKFSFSGGPFSESAFTNSISGNWSFLSGTGAYSSVAGGSGTWSASYSTFSTFSQTTFAGDLRAVPEPASMAILVMGLAGIAARRRNK